MKDVLGLDPFVVDLETTNRGKILGPDAVVRSNSVLLSGYISDDLLNIRDNRDPIFSGPVDYVMIGHNLSFDLSYLMTANRAELDGMYICPKQIRTFDTQYMTHQLLYHNARFISLEEAYTKLVRKPFTKSIDFNKIDPEDVPIDELRDYLIEDLYKTLELAAVICTGMKSSHIPWLPYRTTMLAKAHVQGITLDHKEFTELGIQTKKDILGVSKLLRKNIQEILICNGLPELKDNQEISYTSSANIQAIVNGGSLNIDTWKPGRKTPAKSKYYLSPLTRTTIANAQERTISRLVNSGSPLNINVNWYLNNVLRYKKLSKLNDTYLSKIIDMQKETMDDKIHPTYNQTGTRTGRLSSSKPNGQNNPKEIRELYTPKDSNHVLLKVDFKQLEVIAAAVLSNDIKLMDDLNNGEDIHYNTGLDAGVWEHAGQMTESSRRMVKGIVFLTIYGGGAKTASLQSGVDIEICKRVIDAFKKRYPQLARADKEVLSYMHITQHTKNALYTDDDYDIRLLFEKDTNYGKGDTFSPQQLKNRPPQQFASRIVERFQDEIYREYFTTDAVNIINTVHDDTLLEVNKVWASKVTVSIEDAVKEVELFYNLPVKLEVTVDYIQRSNDE